MFLLLMPTIHGVKGSPFWFFDYLDPVHMSTYIKCYYKIYCHISYITFDSRLRYQRIPDPKMSVVFNCGSKTSCHGRGKPAEAPLMVSCLELCTADISGWCGSRWLQLNGDKTELLWFGSVTHLLQLPQVRSISVSKSLVQPVTIVCDLGVWIDSELSIREHVSHVTQTCIFHLHHLRSVHWQLGHDVSSLVLLWLDYCNAVLAGLPAATLSPFQRVLNAAARLMPRDHVTPALRELHWLPIGQRIECTSCALLVHKTLIVGHAPDYISDHVHCSTGRWVTLTDMLSRSSLRVSSNGNLFLPRTERRFGDHAFSVAAPGRAWIGYRQNWN